MTHDRALNVVIAGGGVAALEAALALRDLAGDLVSTTLVSPRDRFVYRPAVVAEAFGQGIVHSFELAEMARSMGAALLQDTVQAVDLDWRVVRTASGLALPFDATLVAVGAHAEPAVPGAIQLCDDEIAVRAVLDEIVRRHARRVAIVVPAGCGWQLPAYELALFTADLARRGRAAMEVILVTPEEQPLGVFGNAVSDAVGNLLEAAGVMLVTAASAVAYAGGALELTPGPSIAVDHVIALPRLRGPALPGLPADAAGFLRTDMRCRVLGMADVFAAGDAAGFAVKQGGLATQQADAAAQAIAADAGAPVQPEPYRPVLRAVLVSGREPLYLRCELAGGAGDTSTVSSAPMWWPPAKIAGHYLAPFLAERLAEPSTAG